MRVFACLAAILIGLVTAAVSPPPPFQAVENGIDFYGNDIGMVEVGPRDTAACSARCDADGRCQAFSLYTPPPGDKGFCWLKHTVGERRSVAEVTSGLRTSPLAPAPQPQVAAVAAATSPRSLPNQQAPSGQCHFIYRFVRDQWSRNVAIMDLTLDNPDQTAQQRANAQEMRQEAVDALRQAEADLRPWAGFEITPADIQAFQALPTEGQDALFARCENASSLAASPAPSTPASAAPAARTQPTAAASPEPWRCAGAARALYGSANSAHGMMLMLVDEDDPRAVTTARRVAEARALADRLYPNLTLTNDQVQAMANEDVMAIRNACVAANP